MLRNKSFILGALLLTVLGLSQRGDAQSLSQLAWDPSTDNLWTVPEYRVYRNGVLHEKTTGTSSWVPVQPGETVTLAVSSYGWRLDANLNAVWAEGEKSAPLTFTKQGVPVTSPDGTTTPPAVQVVDTQAAIWTIRAGDGAILRNGVHEAGGYGDLILFYGGSIYVRAGGPSWWKYIGAWTQIAGDPRVAVPPPPPPPPPPAVKQCVTNGVPYPVDALLPPYTGKHGQVDAYVLARQQEGWAIFTKTKSKSTSTVQMICKGL